MAEMKPEGLRVLVVDDHMIMRNMITQNLRSLGVQHIESASNGQDAVIELKERRKVDRPYHVVFLDWHMPGMEGLEVLQLCRKEKGFDSTAIVMLTAEQEEKNIRKAIEAGATNYLIKPVARDMLAKNLKKVISWLEKNGPDSAEKKTAAPNKKKAAGIDSLPEDLREQLRPVVAKGVKNIFSELFNVEIISDNQLATAKKNAMVCIGRLHQKDIEIALRFFFDQELLKPLLMQLYSPQYLKSKDVYEDSACEIVNILCAQVKAFLNGHGYELVLDLPAMSAQDEKCSEAHSVLNVHFTMAEDKNFLVDLSVGS